MIELTGDRFTAAAASELYQIHRWGGGYFSISEQGQVLVHPQRDAEHAIDLKQLVDQVQQRGLDLPVLVRFNGILHDRLRVMRDVFARAIEDHQYRGSYACVYPIKVNQQRHVVEQVIRHGRQFGFGLEAGSKPELLAVVAMTDAQMPIVCNGFKDAEFVEMAMMAQKMGRCVIPVVEKSTELDLILHYAEQVGVRPHIGMRVKLLSQGAGRWNASAGYRSKFGLTVSELLDACKVLDSHQMSDCFRLLHFHLGSQITNIRPVKSALNEAARIYCDLRQRGMSRLDSIDVGGGLGVDYDGTQTNSESSMNYTLQEYANDVVYHIQTVCDDAGVAHPQILSESGRAVAAYHSVLVFDVLGVSEQGRVSEIPAAVPAAYEQPLHTLALTLRELHLDNLVESLHDTQQAMEMARDLFASGYLPLDQRCTAENLYWEICRQIHCLASQLERPSEELQKLDAMLSDTYFCNFSLFQSLPDSWAIDQLFPVMPIHRLDQRPDRRAVLADVTCDSDGKIERFIGQQRATRTLELHAFDGSPYYLGAFLTGAYQEILGDLHNLFGDTNTVHVDLTDNGKVTLETIIKGDTVNEVLGYVQYDGRELIHRLQAVVEVAVREQRLDDREAGRLVRFYEQALQGYTYLEELDK